MIYVLFSVFVRVPYAFLLSFVLLDMDHLSHANKRMNEYREPVTHFGTLPSLDCRSKLSKLRRCPQSRYG